MATHVVLAAAVDAAAAIQPGQVDAIDSSVGSGGHGALFLLSQAISARGVPIHFDVIAVQVHDVNQAVLTNDRAAEVGTAITLELDCAPGCSAIAGTGESIATRPAPHKIDLVT